MKEISKFFLVLSGIGYLACLMVHLFATVGTQADIRPLMNYLAPGLIVVWVPMIIILNMTTSNWNMKRGDLWKAILAACPSWLSTFLYGSAIYTAINFFLMMIESNHSGGSGGTSNIRGISGHLLVFYAVAVVSFTAAYRHVESKCSNGHPASPLAKFCEECGAAVGKDVVAS